NANPALKTLAHFANVVAHDLQRADLAVKDLVVVADHAHPRVPADFTLHHFAPGDLADLRNVKDCQDFGSPEVDLAEGGGQHALERLLDVFGQAVDDVVQADRNAFRLGQPARARIRGDVEADHNRVRGRSEHDVAFADVARFGGEDVNL